MERTYIDQLKNNIEKEVSIAGSVHVRRDHGKLIFFDIRDITGIVQTVILPNHSDAQAIAKDARSEWVLEITGVVHLRPEKMVNKDEPNGNIELEAKSIEILGKAVEVPFELGSEVNIDTHLDYLPYTLRTKKTRAIFKVQAEIIKAFRSFFSSEGFTEIQAPKLIGDDAEGGANSFNVEYFKHTAHLAQSPQFYKQIMVGVFERVFTTGNVYRAEKHSTTRHLNEYTSIDIEMGYIKDHTDIMKMEEKFFKYLIPILSNTCANEFKELNADFPLLPDNIPTMKLREAQALITKETGVDCLNEPDLEPQHERFLCEYSKTKFNSDFIFITHFPLSKRPMYTHGDPEDVGYARGFDLLFKGIEITTGGQRIHDYDTLVQSIKNKGLDPDKFSFYLQSFKYGMPPHGGFGMGLERLTAKCLNLQNVKEATLFPRDIGRIDVLLK